MLTLPPHPPNLKWCLKSKTKPHKRVYKQKLTSSPYKYAFQLSMGSLNSLDEMLSMYTGQQKKQIKFAMFDWIKVNHVLTLAVLLTRGRVQKSVTTVADCTVWKTNVQRTFCPNFVLTRWTVIMNEFFVVMWLNWIWTNICVSFAVQYIKQICINTFANLQLVQFRIHMAGIWENNHTHKHTTQKKATKSIYCT